MRTSVVVLLSLLFLLGTAAAEDEKPERKKAPSNPLAKHQRAADAVLEAFEAKDQEALKALAEKGDPDPWLVADLLCYQGEHDATEAFARAAPRADVEKLPAYVEAWRMRSPDKAERDMLAKMYAAMGSGRPRQALRAAALLTEDSGTVVRIILTYGRGVALRRMGRLDESGLMLRRAADAARALGWLQYSAHIYYEAAMIPYRRGRWPDTLPIWRELLALEERRGNKGGAAAALTNIGISQYRLGDYAEALASHGRALAAFQALGDKAEEAKTLGNLAVVHKSLGNYAKALAIHERVLATWEALGDQAGVARALGEIANIHAARGDSAKGLSIYERALAKYVALRDTAGAARTLDNIGLVHQDLGDYAKALWMHERALEAHEEIGNEAGAAAALNHLGFAQYALGDYAKALATQERTLAANEALGDKAGAAVTLACIAIIYYKLGDYAKALSLYERALAAQAALADKGGAATTLGNIALVHAALGDYAKALATHERALAARVALGNKAGAADTRGSIGSLHYALGDYAKALSIFERVLAVHRALGRKARVAGTLGQIGAVQYALGDYAKALATQERVLSQQEALGDKAGAAVTLGNIGSAHAALGDYPKALAAQERALAAKQALGDKAGAALTMGNIGIVHECLGDLSNARRFLERAASAARSLRATPTRVFALKNLARLHLDMGKPSRALARAREALGATEALLGGLGEEQGATAREQYASLFAVGTLAAVRDEDAAEALTFLESGRAGALLDALGKREALRWKAESLPPDLLKADREAQAAASVARHAYERALKTGNLKQARAAAMAVDDATDVVREVAGRIQRELKQRLEQRVGLFYPRAKTLYDIQAALEKDQALVLYGLCLDEALALVLRKDGERMVSLGKVTDLEAACAALDASDPNVDPTEALAALKALLVDPLKLGEDVKQVLVSPDGRLCYLPFGTLFVQAVAMTPSGTTHVLLLDEVREAGKGILSLGNPDYSGVTEGAQEIYHRGRTLSPLPATAPEVEAIGTTTLLGGKASEAGLRESIKASKRWKAVHFACHGLIDVERPMLSSLALSSSGEDDGFLTALEVLRMNIPADLAVLSACETGKGKVVHGEGIMGLTRAFMFAGAPRVICSLWKVDDEATRALMVKFYELWNPKTGKGLGTAAALKKAQAFVRSHEKWKHPYYWAAWVLWGLAD